MARVADYGVGWICAILVEYVAACELLDERYAQPPSDLSSNDSTAYSFGRIGAHRVVIACLPIGKYGTTSATAVAINMYRSFPSIGSYLMVGIGGGVPSEEHDIRLGDVVVSMPDRNRREGGVICYQHGKTIQGQAFRRTDSLNAPPPALLSAVQGLCLSHRREGHHLQETVANLVLRNPRLREEYARPKSKDILYRSGFIHWDEQMSCEGICEHNWDQIVDREPRDVAKPDPVVHYGLIASSDKLMKDAIVRDALAREEGILCVEMEAAGLMDWIPCIVVRGICDYADTHKNDVWHGYAAACAAAYAKELLGVLRGDANMLPLSRDDTDGIKDGVCVIDIDYSQSESDTAVPIQPRLHRNMFDQLTASPIYVVHDEAVMWRKLTVLSWLMYEEIYQSMTPKDRNGYVPVTAFQEKIPEGPVRRLVAEYWLLFKGATLRRPLPKSYGMALLYMLHISKVTGHRWTFISDERLYILRRFAEWVLCSCHPPCGLKWNFANDLGLSVPALHDRGNQQCLAVEYQNSTGLKRMVSAEAKQGRSVDQENRVTWKRQAKDTCDRNRGKRGYGTGSGSSVR